MRTLKRSMRIAVAVLLCAGSQLGAQLATSVCPRGSVDAKGIPDATRIAQDACQQAYDVYQFMAPQLGNLLAGGNAILGTSGNLGGPGHFSLGARVNVFRGTYPDLGQFKPSPTGVQRTTLATKDTLFPLPVAELGLGIFKGFVVGPTRMGGVDALISATYVPDLDLDDFSLKPATNLQLGFGARLGLIDETALTPGVSLTWLKRDLPEIDIIGRTGSDTLRVLKAKVETSAWRLTVGKNFLLFGIAGGVGQEMYDQSANISATVSQGQYVGSATVPGTQQSLTRTNLFLDGSINLPIVKLVAEIGSVSSGIVQTYNSLARPADRARTYVSGGIRFAW